MKNVHSHAAMIIAAILTMQAAPMIPDTAWLARAQDTAADPVAAGEAEMDAAGPAGITGQSQCSDGIDNDADGLKDYDPSPNAFPAKQTNAPNADAFIAATGARTVNPRPGVWLPYYARMTIDDLVLTLISGGIRLVTTTDSPARVAVSGKENFAITLPSLTYGFAFDMVEETTYPAIGNNSNGTVAAFYDSQFSVTFFNGNTVVDSMSLNSDNAVSRTHSFWSDKPFNRIEIRETYGSIDNERFGPFYLSTRPRTATMGDPDCSSADDDSEAAPATVPQCRDGRDNDNDGRIDFKGSSFPAKQLNMPSPDAFAQVTGARAVSPRPGLVGAVGGRLNIDDLVLTLISGGTRLQTTSGAPARVAVSGVERFAVTLPSQTYGFAFEMVEPTTDVGRNANGTAATFYDSLFSVTFFNGTSVVDSLSVNSDNGDNVVRTHSFWSDKPFTRVEIREISGGIDNELFGPFYLSTAPRIVAPADPDCANADDDTENPVITYACNDGQDNDADGLIDLIDPGCMDITDNDESNGAFPQCSDGRDNDADGEVDADDGGCFTNGVYNPNDNDETDPVVASSSRASSVASSIASSSVASSVVASSVQASSVIASSVASPVQSSAASSILSSVQTSSVIASSVASSIQSSAQSSVTNSSSVQTSSAGSVISAATSSNVNTSSVQSSIAGSSVLSSSAQSSVQLQPSVVVTVTDSHATADVGDTLIYSVTITNTSNVVIQNIVATDVLPSSLVFISASDNATVNGQTVTWNIQTLPVGQSRSLTVMAQIRSGTQANAVIRNVVNVTGPLSASGQDDTTVNASSEHDIDITITDSPDPADAGDELDYEIEICNEGDDDIENLTVLQILPDDVEVTDDDGGDEDDGTITWDDIDIDEDDCATLNVTVELDDDLDDGDELETVVLADGQTEEETTEVGEGDDDDGGNAGDGELTVTKEASQGEVFPGGVVEYTVTVMNDTGEDLKDITVKDTLTGGGFVIVDDGDADSRSGGTMTWEIDELEDGDSVVIRYRISVDQSAYPGQLIRNGVSVETDDADDDYEDSAEISVSVINNLPQTGFGPGGNVTGRSQFLRPVSHSPATSGTPLMAVLSVIVAGLGTGAGVGIGRKVLPA